MSLLAACQPTASLTPKEQALMTTLTGHMTPRCFGRYLIDVPTDMKPGKLFGTTFAVFPYSEYSGAVKIEVTPMLKAVFDMRLVKRKTELEKERVMAHPEWPRLASVTPLADGGGEIFNYTKMMARGDQVLELLGWKDGYTIKIMVSAIDESFPEEKDDPADLKAGADTPQKLAILQSLYARTSGRMDDQMPTTPGTCIQNGFVSGPASDKVREDLAMDFVSASMPDVMMHIESDSGIRGENTLLDRVPGIKAMLKAADGHIVRKGHRTAKEGQTFDEVLSTGTTTDHVMGQYFSLEANSKIGSAKTPLINIDFYNGNREGQPIPYGAPPGYQSPEQPPLVKASLSEAESIALWDAITQTLRPRPGAF